MDSNPGHLQLKTQIFTLIVIFSNPFGDLFLTFGMRQQTEPLLLSPMAYIEAIFRPWTAAGIVLLIVWLLARMTLLGWADLSYVLPVTSLGYVLAALLGKLFMGEQISPHRWAGILLIVGGTAIVGRTSVKTTPEVCVAMSSDTDERSACTTGVEGRP